MPYADPATQKAFLSQWHEQRRESRLAAARARYWANHEESKAAARRAANACNARKRAEARKCPDAYRFFRLKEVLNMHGITLDKYHSLLEWQDFCCAICGTDVVSVASRQTHIDHDHETGKVRGILCGKCNTGLGKLGDGKHLDAAVRYIARSRKKAA
jgi:hypothetical protein